MLKYWLRLVASIGLALLFGACCATGDEYRIIPVTAWNPGFLDQADVDKLLGVPGVATSKGDVRNANCNAIIAQVRRRADVCYPSGMGEPYMSGLSPSDFNALQAMINAAHDTTGGKKRIEVHCWLVVFRTANGTVHSEHDDPTDPDNYWVTLNQDGVEPAEGDRAFDPGHPKAEEYIVNVCMDLVNNFDIDGIHYDYIRFTNANQGYNPTSIARYNARYGTTGKPDPGEERFKQWRRDQVTAVVRKVYAKVQASKPWVKVSGSFVGGAPSPAASTREAFKSCAAYAYDYSDWDSWVQEGLVDFAAPMTYFDMTARYSDYVNWTNFQKDRKANRLMVPDAGTYLNYLDDAIEMLQIARNPSPAGNYADGFGTYAYQSPYLATKDPDVYGSWANFSTRLLADITPTWADIPQMPWKTAPTKGHIGGTVTFPPDNAWADGASVEMTGPENRTMLCDGTGFYAFIDLVPGTYLIRANYSGFETTKTVTVTAGAMANGDIALVGTDPTPPVISDLQISNITDGTAQITWTTDDPATTQVQYDFVPYYGQATTENQSKLTSHSVMLDGLTPNTAYHFRIRSVNAAGLVSYSADQSFTTQPLAMTIIVDDSDDSCTLSGSWIPTTSTSGWMSTYSYKSATTGTETASAKWTPALPRTGLYDVSVYYRGSSNRTTDAQYTINYAGGSSFVQVNQTLHDRTWWPIGTDLPFSAGTTGNVRLTNHSTATGNVIADAVKWQYKGDVTAPVMESVTDERYTVSTTSLQASWSGSDPESGVSAYRYAVGTAPGLADVKAWTNAGSSTSATIAGLTLQVGNTYYVSVRAVNGASLTSAPVSSNGVTVARGVASVLGAKALSNGTPICLTSAVVTAKFPTKFYIEDGNRLSGIRVESDASVAPSQTAQVYGRLGILDGCERALTDCYVIPGAMGSDVRPFAASAKYAGGREFGLTPGITGGRGANNLGLLVRLAGRVTEVVSDGFYLDDGSRLTDESGYIGIKVWTGGPSSAVKNGYAMVTGVYSCRKAPTDIVYPQLLACDVVSF